MTKKFPYYPFILFLLISTIALSEEVSNLPLLIPCISRSVPAEVQESPPPEISFDLKAALAAKEKALKERARTYSFCQIDQFTFEQKALFEESFAQAQQNLVSNRQFLENYKASLLEERKKLEYPKTEPVQEKPKDKPAPQATDKDKESPKSSGGAPQQPDKEPDKDKDIKLPPLDLLKNEEESINQDPTAIRKKGFYEVNGVKFSERYYERLWQEGRPAPSLRASDILKNTKESIPDIKPGFFRYEYDGWEMIYNPKTKEVWHLQPMKK